MAFRMRWWLVVVYVVVTSVCMACGESGDLEEQMRVLSKQVTTLLDRRREDLQMIEDNMRRKLFLSPELVDVKEEMQNLRNEIAQLRTGNFHKSPHHQQHKTQEQNEHLTLKWLSNTVTELKTELSEIQTTLNSTVILQNHEQLDTELSLLKTDVANLNKEFEIAKSKNAKYEAEILEMREELGALKDHFQATAVMCGKTKNQLKAAQLEWNYNWKMLNENKSSTGKLQLDDKQPQGHSSRHQRLLKKHVIDLEKTVKHLNHANEELQSKLLKMEEEIRILQQDEEQSDETFDRIAGNEINNFIKKHKINEIKIKSNQPTVDLKKEFINLSKQQKINTDSIFNLSKQLTNFDKLHLSMLELLENVESIENNVNKNFPEFRKEISKLELQTTVASSELAMIKEDHTNTRKSVKAIGVSVSNLQDKVDNDRKQLKDLSEVIENLKKSSSMQTSKLHDHILKAESSTIDLNSTKSTIHLVQELKTFEKEYKSIVNKLPHDCSSVAGTSGIYLISPGDGEPILANCEDGWTTIQKRYDGSVNFNRNWNEYSNGFGSATGEHWLGNRNLHALTRNNCTKLQINMKDIYGKYWQANYDDFRVADYSIGFKLVVDKYRGNASDALDYQNHMEFSTIDNDRDISNTHCASNYEGGWWFSHCQHANLNGRYNLGLTWFDSSRNEWIAVATSEMRVKRKEIC